MPSDTIIFNWLVSLHLFVASAADKASYSCNCDNTRIEFHYSTVRPSIKAKMPLDIIRALINKLIRILLSAKYCRARENREILNVMLY